MSSPQVKEIIVIAGPTATGKTELSVELAKRINGEVISADSMQVYKHMDIGTAKPSQDEMQGIRHYLIDEILPDEEYSAAIFSEKADKYAEEIFSKGKTPILCGGTGFYINAFVYGNNFTETNADSGFRESLFNLAKEKGNLFLHEMLKARDSDAALVIHPNNVKRVVRALEFYEQTGQKISEHNLQGKNQSLKYKTSFFILDMDRELLYNRIEKRIDLMLVNGLIDEVKHLLSIGCKRNLVSMQGLGYKEIAAYLDGECSLEEAVFILKRGTRHFAKRQITWFKHQLRDEAFRLMAGADENIDVICNYLSRGQQRD